MDLHQSKFTPPVTRESIFIQSDKQPVRSELRYFAPGSRRRREFAANNTTSPVNDTTFIMGIKEHELIAKTIKRKLNNKYKFTFRIVLCELKAKVMLDKSVTCMDNLDYMEM